MRNRIKASLAVTLCTLALAGCDILDVNNPNNLVEESVRQESAASAVVNGALSLTASSISQVWQPYLMASDEMFWIGSRDAWLSLDQGFVEDPNNEFSDGAFPSMGKARWMGDEAIEILTEHVGNNPSTALKNDLARGYLYSGIMYMVIGEIQEDFAFSDKTEDGAPIGPSNMSTVLDQAISKLDQAISMAREVGDAGTEMNAMAVRARAKQSRAIWDKLNPGASGSNGMVNSAGAGTDAAAVIAMAGGAGADWQYDLTYSSGTVGNSMASWVNDRKENQFDLSLVSLNAANDIDGIVLQDPIDGIDDPALINRINQFKGGSYLSKGGPYSPMTIASTRLMHMILAENALASGDNGGFTTHINHVRAMDGLTPYAGQMDAETLLQHSRRVNLVTMGLRLADMYRFGVKAAEWESGGAAFASPGTMLPITIIEIRANCHLNGLGCGG